MGLPVAMASVLPQAILHGGKIFFFILKAVFKS